MDERAEPNPALDKEQAEGSRDTVDEALEADEVRARDRRQGITNRPAAEEAREQAELPPRGQAKRGS